MDSRESTVTRKNDEKEPKRNADVSQPADEDPLAAERLQEILHSASYRRADLDTDFLNTDETRGLRLNLEYLKVNLLLERHGIKQTIVVFGSTCILEASEARRRVDRARAELQKDPDNPILVQGLQIAERVSAKSTFYAVAREFGSLVGSSGEGPKDCRVVLMTGGGPGIMEAANRGAFDVGAESVGLNISLPQEQFPNAYVTPGLCFNLRYFAIRKLHVLLRARALVVFPGGFGTLDELFETLTLLQTRKIEPLPVILVGESYWRKAFDPDFLLQEGVIDLQDRDLFWYAETAQEIWDGICQWHRDSGSVLHADVQSAN
jgi:uncharacterized protein (TIGR00730 family)